MMGTGVIVMGMRFRKSINLGGGFRINLSKSGIGYSCGVPGYRITKTAKGTVRKTTSIPGTGIFWVEEHKTGQKKALQEKKGGRSMFGFGRNKVIQQLIKNAKENGIDAVYLPDKKQIQTQQFIDMTTQEIIDGSGSANDYRVAFFGTIQNACNSFVEALHNGNIYDVDVVMRVNDSDGRTFCMVENGIVVIDLITGAKEEAERRAEQQTQPHYSSDAAEIMKFKELLDQGIITEEEFSAKKRKLLGL